MLSCWLQVCGHRGSLLPSVELGNFISFISFSHPSLAAAGELQLRCLWAAGVSSVSPLQQGVSLSALPKPRFASFISVFGDKKDVSPLTPRLHYLKITQRSTVMAGNDKCNFATSAL